MKFVSREGILVFVCVLDTFFLQKITRTDVLEQIEYKAYSVLFKFSKNRYSLL